MNSDSDFKDFIDQIKKKTGIDLALYKEQQMKRRLTTLRQKHGYASFHDFYNAMVADGNLFNVFLDRMTINVSEFWRNPSRWEVLAKKFLPTLLKQSSQLKCWSAACSTGEEPYSLAMILAELGVLDSASITATDLDENVLKRAQEGVYPERSVVEVPELYLNKYFQKNELGYYISPKLKPRITFGKMNLLADEFPATTMYDLIICRNVTIYFTDEAKRSVYEKMSNLLRPGGILFVGSTEQIFSRDREEYKLEAVEPFFYRKY